MKIALINNIYFPEGSGGGEMVVKHRAFQFAKEGHEVTIIVPGESKSTEQIGKSVTLVRFKPVHIFLYKNASKYPWIIRLIWHVVDAFNLVTYFQIRSILKRRKPDKVECHNLKGVGFLIPSLMKALRISFVMYLHDIQLAIPSGILLFGEEKKQKNNGLFQRLYEKIIKSLVGSPDTVIFPSNWLHVFYESRGFFKKSEKEILTHPSFDSGKIEAGLKELQEKIKTEAEIHVVYVVKLEVYKGVVVLLSVWKLLSKNYYLSIYGAGSLEGLVLNTSNNDKRVTYQGHQTHEKIIPNVQQADVLVMPTLCYENRPEVILEAFNVGTPVIASNLGGVTELIKDGATGILFTPGNVEGLVSIFKNGKKK